MFEIANIIAQRYEDARLRDRHLAAQSHEGSEYGGLILGGHRNAKGEIVNQGGSLSFDKYDANQIVQLLGVDDKEDRFSVPARIA